jgi:hypothetical protein
VTLDNVIECHTRVGRNVRPDHLDRGRMIYSHCQTAYARLNQLERVHRAAKAMWRGVQA